MNYFVLSGTLTQSIKSDVGKLYVHKWLRFLCVTMACDVSGTCCVLQVFWGTRWTFRQWNCQMTLITTSTLMITKSVRHDDCLYCSSQASWPLPFASCCLTSWCMLAAVADSPWNPFLSFCASYFSVKDNRSYEGLVMLHFVMCLQQLLYAIFVWLKSSILKC